MAIGYIQEITIVQSPTGTINHFALEDEDWTFCGTACYDWAVIRRAKLQDDINSPKTCKRCIRAAVS